MQWTDCQAMPVPLDPRHSAQCEGCIRVGRELWCFPDPEDWEALPLYPEAPRQPSPLVGTVEAQGIKTELWLPPREGIAVGAVVLAMVLVGIVLLSCHVISRERI